MAVPLGIVGALALLASWAEAQLLQEPASESGRYSMLGLETTFAGCTLAGRGRVELQRKYLGVVLEIRVTGEDCPISAHSHRAEENVHGGHADAFGSAVIVGSGGRLVVFGVNRFVREGAKGGADGFKF